MSRDYQNPYNAPQHFAPYGNSGVGPQNPNAGNTGEPWGAQYASYGLEGQRNGTVQYSVMARERLAIQRIATFWRGVAGDEQAVYYGILTPQTYLRPTVPVGTPATVSGPIEAMAFRGPEGNT